MVLLKIALCLVFGFLGLLVTSWGFLAIHNRQKAVEAVQEYGDQAVRGAKTFVPIWTALTFSSGLSMLLASVLIWRRIPLALVLGLWPIALIALLYLPQRNEIKAGWPSEDR